MKIIPPLLAAALTAIVLVPGLMAIVYLYGQFTLFPFNDPYIWVRTALFFTACLAISTIHVMLLGMPAYALLSYCRGLRWWSATAGGFLLGALPVAVLTWPLRYAETGMSASFDGVQTMADGIPTAAGWISYARSVFFFASCGALSGLAFWWVLQKQRKGP